MVSGIVKNQITLLVAFPYYAREYLNDNQTCSLEHLHHHHIHSTNESIRHTYYWIDILAGNSTMWFIRFNSEQFLEGKKTVFRFIE